MSFQDLIDTYGYAVIIIGAFLEGETVLVLGGVAAKLGYLELHWVILSAFAATLLSDQLLFFLGRYKGNAVLARVPSWQPRVDRTLRFLEKHRLLIILGFRFLYGMRTVTPFVIGMSSVPASLFVILNIISAAAWASLVTVLGYVFGHGMELLIGDIKRYEFEFFVFIVAVGTMLWLIRRLRT